MKPNAIVQSCSITLPISTGPFQEKDKLGCSSGGGRAWQGVRCSRLAAQRSQALGFLHRCHLRAPEKLKDHMQI